MFIRKTQHKKKRTGGYYSTYRIVESKQDVKQESPDYRTVNLDSIKTCRPRSIGCEHAVLEALRTLELDVKLTSLGFNGIQAALAIGTIVGRACHPASERETHRWLQDQSGLGELIDFDFQQVSLNRNTVSDQLLKHKDAIERHLDEKECTLFFAW